MTTALVVSAHGTPDSLDDLPAFLTQIRRGRPPTPEILHEVRRRYEAIGGRSPLLAITQAQADGLAKALDLRAHVAMRLWHPYPSEIVPTLVAEGVTRVVSVPIAPYSVHVYHAALAEALEGTSIELVRIPAWNLEPTLIEALSRGILEALPGGDGDVRPLVVMSAHSLPTRVLAGGDPYADLVRATADAVGARLPAGTPWRLSFQSQGMTSDTWLGPDLPTTYEQAKREGFTHVLMAPIGFLSDHIEVLYDLDLEARDLAKAQGLTLSRTRTLNADPALIDTLAAVVRRALAT